MRNDLQHQVSDLVDRSGLPKQQVLNALVLAMAHCVAEKTSHQPLSKAQLIPALRTIEGYVSAKLEAELGRKWHDTKVKRLLHESD
jgi:hypothetical protein